MGMVGIGFNTDFIHIKKLGLKPLLVGIVGTVIVTVVSYTTIVILNFT